MPAVAPKKTCIIIAGPTAVGKTGIAIQLAQAFQTSIISADSRQCFKELNIGVAKPSQQELAQVKHYFINSHSITEEVNAGVFEQYALAAVGEIFNSHDIAIVAGGTGLYLRAFTDGMDDMPVIDKTVREEIQRGYEAGGLSWLQDQIRQKDPSWGGTGEMQNPQRIMRALEVVQTSGLSILSYRKQQKVTRPFRIIKIGLTLPRALLYERINQRVDDMMDNGLEAEAASLLPYRQRNALQTVGYTELFEYLDGNRGLSEAVSLIKRNSRHYAKRQLTWFQRDQDMKWYSSFDSGQLIDHLDKLV